MEKSAFRLWSNALIISGYEPAPQEHHTVINQNHLVCSGCILSINTMSTVKLCNNNYESNLRTTISYSIEIIACLNSSFTDHACPEVRRGERSFIFTV